MSELNLCKDHKQEWKQSEYDTHNCDYCKLKSDNYKLIDALKEFDNDDNWRCDYSYSDRPVSGRSADRIYIGKYDPRVFATMALKLTPLENTKDYERLEPSDYYTSSQKEISILKAQLKKAESALRFYSNYDNWIESGGGYLTYQSIVSSDEEFVTGYGETGGKHAREYFKDRR